VKNTTSGREVSIVILLGFDNLHQGTTNLPERVNIPVGRATNGEFAVSRRLHAPRLGRIQFLVQPDHSLLLPGAIFQFHPGSLYSFIIVEAVCSGLHRTYWFRTIAFPVRLARH
jgi:hypothetical protein